MAYQVWSVVFGEQPTAAKWNILGSNDASFNDGTGIANNAILTAHINDAAVTIAKLANMADGDTIDTSQTTTSTSYTDLATVGPTATVTVGPNGKLLVGIMSYIQHAISSGNTGWASFALSGANTLAASDANGIMYQTWTANAFTQNGGLMILEGLNAGSTTVTMKYRGSSANLTTYQNRKLVVIPL